MKTTISLLALLLLSLTAVFAQGEVVITFTYQRQAGPGSNQFAVYIENPQGDIVRTLYVTKFTADGGYVKRPACVPIWVNKSGISEMSEAEVDAVTSATPQPGLLKYVWDLRDATGNTVDDGTYYFVVEGTYWGDNQVLFRNAITIGASAVKVNAPAEFNSDEEKNRGMLSEVYAEYNP